MTYQGEQAIYFSTAFDYREVLLNVRKLITGTLKAAAQQLEARQREMRHRRGVNHHVLNDIGLSTQQVRYVVSRPNRFE